MTGKDALPPSIQTCEGDLNGKPVTVMLDSGCTTVGVRTKLCFPEQFTGEYQDCRLFTGEVVTFPLVKVNLNTQYFAGEVLACAIDNPVCDVILGRIPGCTYHCVEMAAAVQTRAQVKREERPFRPLLTAKAPQLDITKDQVEKLQKQDQRWRGRNLTIRL